MGPDKCYTPNTYTYSPCSSGLSLGGVRENLVTGGLVPIDTDTGIEGGGSGGGCTITDIGGCSGG